MWLDYSVNCVLPSPPTPLLPSHCPFYSTSVFHRVLFCSSLFFPENEPILVHLPLVFFSHYCFLYLPPVLAYNLFLSHRTCLPIGYDSSSYFKGTFPEIYGRSNALPPEVWVEAHCFTKWSSAFRAKQMTEPCRHTEIFYCIFEAITKQTDQNKQKKRECNWMIKKCSLLVKKEDKYLT